jgi:uncharacterized protein DUF1016
VTMVISNPRRARSAAGAPMSYETLISTIAEVHARTQTGAAGAVNRYLTLRNWFIGAYVVQFEQNGADRASYGQQLLVHLARDLARRRIPGCSPEMLGRMRVFYRTYPQLGENSSSPFATESGTSLAPTQIEISSPAVTKSDTALPTPLGGQTPASTLQHHPRLAACRNNDYRQRTIRLVSCNCGANRPLRLRV